MARILALAIAAAVILTAVAFVWSAYCKWCNQGPDEAPGFV
jgi:hypothetical protein